MHNRFIALLVVLCLIVTAAYANTTHYNYNTPTVGGSQNTWGTSLNTIFNSIDTNIWSASGGTTIGLNATTTAGNFTLANPINNVQSITMSTTGKHVALPIMNAATSPVPGGVITFINSGTNAFAVTANDGTTSVIGSLTAGQVATVQALTNSTTNGTWQADGPYITSIGTLSLGTSVTTASPSISGDATTGFYTAGAAEVDVTVSGTQRGKWTTTGEVVTGTLAGSSSVSAGGALLFTGTGAAGAAQTGVHSTTASALSLMTSGVDRVTVGSDGGVTIGAPTGGSKGVGTLNVAGSVYSAGVVIGGVVNITYQSFCASGCTHTSGTYTPTSGTKFIIARAIGGGGGGGGVNTAGNSGAGGGGAGGYGEVLLTVAQAGTPTITVGAAGAAGANTGGTGGTGGTTSIGSLISCTGGAGGVGSTAIGVTAGGAGGVCAVTTGSPSGIDLSAPGSPGFGNSAQESTGGYGGSSPFGQGGIINFVYTGTATPGFAGTGFGSGGSGAGNQAGTAEVGGAGTGGQVIFEEFQ